MTIDKNRLKALAQKHLDMIDCGDIDAEIEARDEFEFEARSDVVLALLGEIERLEARNLNQLRSNLSQRKRRKEWVERAGKAEDEAIDAEEQRDQLKAENEKFDEGMRSLAFQLSAGGYNAETLTAEQLVGKVTDGLASFAESSGRLLDQVRAERDALRSQVATLQAEPNSYQSGFDAGRAAEKAHADNWREEAARLKDQAATLKRDADRFQFIAQDAESSLERIYGDNWLGALDCLMGADKEASHD
ncbi:hypothetical protein NJC38_02655 [Pseudomonas sp. 21LCFQ010]|uniref:hypothetical protein n=1 Tax=Pseudomonas sp. 21LCFQ010 TaxID=2957506 RepID=UPI002098336F|nr:hypothetical protein [Pseudomonas sp. 21LCFQ010]MCO8161051.1 hypothetical protein [Pseudomonas sp. 21LCFQ010]